MRLYIMLYDNIYQGSNGYIIPPDRRKADTQHKVEGESVTTPLFLHTTRYYTEQMHAGHIPSATAYCSKKERGRETTDSNLP